MPYIYGNDRSNVLLFPEALDDYITAENPIRFIDAFVSSLDLSALGFTRSTPADTGRPAYSPADLLRLYIYGYLNRVRSSRLLEREAHRNVEVMWLIGKPDAGLQNDRRFSQRQSHGDQGCVSGVHAPVQEARVVRW